MDQVDPTIFRILQLIEIQINRKITTFNDAKWLSGDMLSHKIHVSPHTIARLYGVVKPFRKPYRFTLDNLSKYAGFHDWKTYNQSCFRQTPGTDLIMNQNQRGFSLSRMEVAIITRNHDGIINELELLDANSEPLHLNEIASRLVHYIRTENQATDILRYLAGTAIGRRMFYDFFVDEDDQDEYYFNALKTYYLPGIQSVKKRLFVIAYLISKEAYRNNRLAPQVGDLEQLSAHFTIRSLHYQELSRYLEALIIRDGYTGKLEELHREHLRQVIAYAGKKTASHEASWILYRPLKALIFFGFKETVLHDPSVGYLLETILRKINIRNASTADFAIQLIFLAGNKNINGNDYQPFKLQSHYLHCDSKERQSMEIATACLLADSGDEEFYRTNLIQYCNLNSATWVCRLLF